MSVILGVNYIAWRWLDSINWSAWWISIPLVVAETYGLIDISLFAMTMWRSQGRPAPPAPDPGATVDVFITTCNEPLELVMNTAIAAQKIRFPHQTWILDDGERTEMRAAAEEAGIGYVTRSADWKDRPRHAKAGNLNNALECTAGEFILVLDADQIPRPEILHNTLGYFRDEGVAVVQTPQVFSNVPEGDPLGSQAELFYGPIQQGKDGWNAAFYCGSNAVLRREALMQLGVVEYAREVDERIAVALPAAARVVERERARGAGRDESTDRALSETALALEEARAAMGAGVAVASVTFELHRRVSTADRPLSDSVRNSLSQIVIGSPGEAQPIMPLATDSVTEDLATCMRLHGLGWKSVYHHEPLADGLAPDDVGSMLTQRLRWAQGTIQVFLRENPLGRKTLTIPQRLMYFATMWTYLSGFATVVYLAAPIIFLVFGILPVATTALEFFIRFIPFIVMNCLLFFVAAHRLTFWRGQQYSVALFPVWISACATAFTNVVFRRPLGFAVTPKTRQESAGHWRLVRVQLVTMALLVLAMIIGLFNLMFHRADLIATVVNLACATFDLVALSVLIVGVRYQGFTSSRAATRGARSS
ncbi:glycosyltransferase family 2 protein [Microbacterium rhizomatis]|nr:glycosyltransferase family 2 protein [Microbacterium rhizomatis]